MKPIKAAIQLTQVWRIICPDGKPYPVNCRAIAEALNIKVHGEPINDNFEAQLRIRGKRRAIIYNDNIREEGRKNFCISHEIGHHSCHSDQKEFFCSSKDLNDMAPHPQNIEQEANLFAATLLMPADDFREQISGKKPTLSLLSNLADFRYETSLTATCMRLLDLSPQNPFGMAIIRNGRIVRWARTEEMRWTGFGFQKNHKVPSEASFADKKGQPVDSRLWLNANNANRWDLFQSSVFMPYYDQTLVLIEAERKEASGDDWDVPDTTPSSLPNFK